jgi:hypothetical protein
LGHEWGFADKPLQLACSRLLWPSSSNGPAVNAAAHELTEGVTPQDITATIKQYGFLYQPTGHR